MSLRIALRTEEPLPVLQCMYPIALDSGNDLTIQDLLKRIKSDLQLEPPASSLSLWLGDFQFLPWQPLIGLLRENELISVRNIPGVSKGLKRRAEEEIEKEDGKSTKTSKKVRKARKEEKKKDEAKKLEQKEQKRAKKEEKKKEKEKEKAKAAEKEKRKDKKQEEEKKKEKKEREEEDKKVQTDNADQDIVNRGKPYEGSSRTKKRNQRRRKLKQFKRQEALQEANTKEQTQEQSNDVQNASDELYVSTNQDEYYTGYPSTGHIYFDNEENVQEEQVDNQDYFATEYPEQQEPANDGYYAQDQEAQEQQEEEQEDANEDAMASGFSYTPQAVGIITAHEGYPNHKRTHQINNFRYPVQTSDVIYADVTEQKEEFTKTYSYDELRNASFTEEPTPKEGEILAIRAIEMTENYTPEISDWKHVKVIQVDPDAQQVAVEILPEFVKKKTKGKFDLTINDEEEDEEEERTRTYDFADFVAIKYLS